jgi:glycosyltransferase involved in cell wall biosynthesis
LNAQYRTSTAKLGKKPTVAVFASTLTQQNPRGALRLFRALAEELERLDEFECLVLHERIAGQTHPLFPVSTLGAWLNEHPLPVARVANPPEPSAWEARVRKLKRKARTALKLGLRALASLLPIFVRQVMKNLWQLRHDVVVALQSATPRATPYHRVASLAEIDVVLNFWWFHVAGNPLEGCTVPAHVKVVSWFLDAIPLRVGHCDPTGFVNVESFMRAVMTHLRIADEVVAISPSAADDVQRFFGLPAKRIQVIPCGVAEKQPPISGNSLELRRRLRLSTDLPIVLCLGLEEPSKNILNVLRACRLSASKSTKAKFQVVLVGEVRNPSMHDRQQYLATQLRRHVPVCFAGYLCDSDVRTLMGASQVLLYPSLWEGFGMPPLEAMQAGAQVVTSEIGPMSWICDRFAHYCDPFDPADIARALDTALAVQGAERAAYKLEAAAHAENFTWAESARELATLITRLATADESSHAIPTTLRFDSARSHGPASNYHLSAAPTQNAAGA